jgi:hypothetical protein
LRISATIQLLRPDEPPAPDLAGLGARLRSDSGDDRARSVHAEDQLSPAAPTVLEASRMSSRKVPCDSPGVTRLRRASTGGVSGRALVPGSWSAWRPRCCRARSVDDVQSISMGLGFAASVDLSSRVLPPRGRVALLQRPDAVAEVPTVKLPTSSPGREQLPESPPPSSRFTLRSVALPQSLWGPAAPACLWRSP